MGKHVRPRRGRLTRRLCRAELSRLETELSITRGQYADLEIQFKETFRELMRLKDLYEPEPDPGRPPQTSWGIANEDRTPTEEVPVPVITILPDPGMDESTAFELRDRNGLLDKPGGEWP